MSCYDNIIGKGLGSNCQWRTAAKGKPMKDSFCFLDNEHERQLEEGW